MIIQRDLLEEIKPFLKRQEFIAIVGPRQSGKTTLLKLIRDYLRTDLKIDEFLIQTLTFEDRKLLAEFEADAVSFVRSYFPAKSLLELVTDRELFKLSQYLATQISNVLVYQNLQQISNLDYRRLKRHLNILKETFIIQEVAPFFKNRQKELSKNPKVFFADLGFRNSLMENMNVLSRRSDSGAIVENAVFIRLNEIFKEKGRINFWRTKAGAEADFVLQSNGRVIPVEVKFSKFDKERVSRSLISFIKYFNSKYGIVLTKDYWGRANKNGADILFAPAYYL